MQPPSEIFEVLGPGLDVVFCGISPATATGFPFASSTNRFWKVLYRAGFTSSQIRPSDYRTILDHRCGLTAASPRPTPDAGDLSRRELREGGIVLAAKIELYAPRVIAFLGKAALYAIRNTSNLDWGRQALPFAGAVAWVLPNPSGRNRAFSESELVRAFGELREDVAEKVA